ncbi:MAG: 30S ribosomal protein S4 [candidate division NC10 bacterium]|jgi:small subunit ribosomal protein S4|nr:30S ribosomal protein S4 [candidate division NC10 bacterium]HET7853692.1 30S ribosomal protein S4 [Candidatus Methylomirabilis sp.]
MARYTGSVCKLCRREGLKLFLKGDRCFSPKCAIEKRNYPPGEHGQRRRVKLTDYGLQLREKQKMKRIYGIVERQFRNYFRMAEHQKGITGENLLRFLERRLENVVYRLGFASSRAEARQMVTHGHFLVNGRRVDIPSYLVDSGDQIQVAERSRELLAIKGALEGVKKRGLPAWLELDAQALRGVVRALPAREDMVIPVQEQLVVALYSK